MDPIRESREIVELTERVEEREERLEEVATQLIKDLEYFVSSGYRDEMEKNKRKAAAIEHQLISSTQGESRDFERILKLLAGVMTFNRHSDIATKKTKAIIVKLREKELLLDKAERLIEAIPKESPDYVIKALCHLKDEIQVTRRLLQDEDKELAA